jgi:phage/plasmid-like protein (TIGR03299 family)
MHLIETMAYANETPWHGLGNKLSAKSAISVWAKQAGMEWTIQESPVYYQVSESSGHTTFNEQKVLYRSDTGSALSVVSQRFQVVQPRDVLEFYRDLTKAHGFMLETAGVLKGGRKVWALAKTNMSANIKGNDTLNGYLLLATGCDGTLATTAQFTSIRVVCNNTLAIALKDGTAAVKVPHSTTFDPKAVKQQLGLSSASWTDFIYQMKKLSERKVKSNEAEAFVSSLLTDPAAKFTNERAVKKILELYGGHGRGADLASSKGTAFGLLNAVTEFVDHERRARSTDYRLDSAWFGTGANLKNGALTQAIALIA